MKRLLCTAALAAATLPAAAGLITFDPLDEQGATLAPGDSFTAQGFVFTQLSGNVSTLFAGDTAGAYASNGSNTLYAANQAAFSLAAADGSGFALLDLALGGGNLGFLADPGSVAPWAPAVLLQGLFGDGSSQQLTLAVDPASATLALQSVGWTGLRELRFSAQGDFSLDDLRLQAVPEPAGLTLLGLALLAGLRRRRGNA